MPTPAATQPGGRLDRVPNPAPIPLTRRRLLAGAAGLALLITGCATGAPRAPDPAPRDPLADLLDEHVSLAAAYRAAATELPDDPRLPGLGANLEQQITALAGALAVPAPPVPTPAAGEAGAAEPSASVSAADPATLVGTLRERETQLATQCGQLALQQQTDRAPLLASLCAAHRCAAEVLT